MPDFPSRTFTNRSLLRIVRTDLERCIELPPALMSDLDAAPLEAKRPSTFSDVDGVMYRSEYKGSVSERFSLHELPTDARTI